MSNTALVKPSKLVKESTAGVRMHLDVVNRARESYVAAIKRAEADYFEKIKRATEAMVGEVVVGPNGAHHDTPANPAEASQASA